MAVAARSDPATHDARVRELLERALPSLDGSRLKFRVFEVTYAPNGSDEPHRHPCPVIGYVLDGALRAGIGGGPERILHVGDTFFEPANEIHGVSANSSEKEPVRFLAIFLCDNTRPLSVAEPR